MLKTVLVSGGAGFIGFHLCKRLLDEGQSVVCLDNMSTGSDNNVMRLARFERFQFIRHDVVDPIALKVDRIFNLACPASPPAYQSDPVKTILTNVVGVKNLLDLARANDARILQASTSEVYGDPLVHPQPETYLGNVSTMGPRACYDEGKRCAETLMDEYHRLYGVDGRIARIFNTYGPDMRVDDGRVVSTFIVEALNGSDIPIQGDGSHTRSMCFVDDLVEGLMRLMDLDAPYPHPVNLGNDSEISVLDFANKVLAKTSSPSRLRHLPEAINDPRVRCPDITRARDILGWRPLVSLDEGLEKTIAHFSAVLAETKREDILYV